MRDRFRPKPHLWPPARLRSLTALVLAWFGTASWSNLASARAETQHIEDSYSYSTNPRETVDLAFLDGMRGWILVSDHPHNKSHLYSTRDGGETWAERRAPTGVYKLSFTSARLGWALQMTKGGAEPPLTTLLRTETGGETWTRLPTDGLARANRKGYILVSLGFANSLSGWIAGAGPENTGVILQTTDGGKSFHRPNEKLASLATPLGMVVPRDVVWIYGESFTLCSQDGGKTWTAIDPAQFGTVPDNFNVYSGFLSEKGRGWLVGNIMEGTILSTDGFGRNWKIALQTTVTGSFDAISAWDDEHACAVEGPTRLYCTADGGVSWTARDVLPKPEHEQARFFLKLVMLASGRGWLLRAGGYLYQTEDGGQSWNPFDAAGKQKAEAHLRASPQPRPSEGH